MKVFISWSGSRSRYIGEALAEWLPDVIQAIEPFLSTNDIPKGTRWGTAVASELEGTSVGIVCLTPENLDSRWIHYEVGALSKMIADARICTYLYELQPGRLLSPLADFQATTTDKDDTFKMLFSVNAALGKDALSTEKLRKAFEKWWNVLEEKLKGVPKTEEASKAPSLEESLQELLKLMRADRNPPRCEVVRLASDGQLLSNFQNYSCTIGEFALGREIARVISEIRKCETAGRSGEPGLQLACGVNLMRLRDEYAALVAELRRLLAARGFVLDETNAP